MELTLARLPLDWLTEDTPAKRFQELRRLPATAKKELFAAAVARLLTGQLSYEDLGGGREATFEATVARLQGFGKAALDLEWPAELFWSRLTKATIFETAGEVLGDDWVAEHKALKKGELAEAAASAFTDQQWVPRGFLAFDSTALESEY